MKGAEGSAAAAPVQWADWDTEEEVAGKVARTAVAAALPAAPPAAAPAAALTAEQRARLLHKGSPGVTADKNFATESWDD